MKQHCRLPCVPMLARQCFDPENSFHLSVLSWCHACMQLCLVPFLCSHFLICRFFSLTSASPVLCSLYKLCWHHHSNRHQTQSNHFPATLCLTASDSCYPTCYFITLFLQHQVPDSDQPQCNSEIRKSLISLPLNVSQVLCTWRTCCLFLVLFCFYIYP